MWIKTEILFPGREYYTYDTYMKLSDYNALRAMLGKKKITLKENEYALQTKSRIARDLGEELSHQKVTAGDRTLTFHRSIQRLFPQNGINGADYLIIVPDELCGIWMPTTLYMWQRSKEKERKSSGMLWMRFTGTSMES